VDLFAPGPRDEALAGSLALDTALVLAFVGEARRKKGLTVLLLAFARLCAQHDPLPSLLLVGGVRRDDAPVVEVFQRQNPALKLHVVPPVPHGELPAYYRLADLLVFPSLHDGMPNALLEGMACGRAVVASEVGGIADIVRYAEADVARAATGVLVPAGDAEALTRAMHELLSDPSRRARLGTAARAAVVAGFTPAQELERNLEVYRQVRGER
jgi:glycosyltransferase involved in cell wall biosynthesis